MMGNVDKMRYLSTLFVGLVVLGSVSSVPYRLFYPFGESRGDSRLRRSDDISSTEIQLRTPIHFYNGLYSSVFVNSNGHLSFESELPGYQATLVMPLDLGIKLISAFMSDVDISIAGNVYFRESTEEALLGTAALDVQEHFSEFPLFEPLSLFIATWDGVAAFRGSSNEVNTFQIVIASDELNSFVIFNYLDSGIQWTKSAGKLSGIQADPPGQAGFDSGIGRLHMKLPYSGTDRIELLARESNVNEPGKWMFHIGEIKDDGNIQPPDGETGDVEIFIPEVENPTCLEGSRTCHSGARCVDFEEGFCCECIPPSFGNGIQCISPGQPQRLNGKVSGSINDITFDDLDMHAFVVTKDGRAYVVISRVPEQIGSYILTLNTIGGVIGWMFAIKEDGNLTAINGYTYTGGKFTREAVISYRAGGSVVIRQTFYGYDALNNIRMETHINGSIPNTVGSLTSITVDDYQEEYRRVGPGMIKSFSERTYRVDQTAYVYTWDQTISFDECTADPSLNRENAMRLSVSKNFLSYENNVVRFAMTNKIAIDSGIDPCQEGASVCHENADCVPSADSFTCSCRTGFVGDGYTCEDLNECEIGLNTCSENARCFNVPGSFQCQCNPGFRGDGRTCTADVELCGSAICSEYARCVYDDVQQQPVCECRSGFMGNGVDCSPIVFDCNEVDICDDNADCIYSQEEQRYVCECVEGFSGDGQYCERYKRQGDCNCAPNSDCILQEELYYRCICKEGYTGDGVNYCTEIRDFGLIDCDRCHPDATCREGYVDSQLRRYCQCNPGFVGDGISCAPANCREANVCDINARCVQAGDSQYFCQCNPGYRGDGYRCVEEGCNILNNCASDAECVADPRDTSRYLCRCKPGFSGDGYVCIPRVIPCNEVNNCGRNAECVYDPEALSYRCRCERGYEGNGFNCSARGSNCRRDLSLCDPNAACILNVDRFECVCNPSYRGDGTVCIAMVDGDNYLLFSRGYSLHKVPYNLNGEDKDGSRVLYVPDELAVGVASDCAEQHFYWTDVTNGRVSRAGIDGLDQEVVAQGFQSPEGIAIDFLSRNMYVTDSGLDVIAVANLNGTYKKTLISENLDDPRAIVLDPQRGVMYWTDWYRSNPTIEKANMDGSDRQVFVDTDLGLPNGLTMDPYTQQICWGDAGVNRIECIRSDGVGRRVITEEARYPFDVTMYGNAIYWSDWTVQGVPSIDFNGGEVKDALPLPVGGNGRLYGITSVGEFCPRVNNACYRSNGRCRYLCLPTPNGGRTCACPDDIDDVTCSEIGTLSRK